MNTEKEHGDTSLMLSCLPKDNLLLSYELVKKMAATFAV